MMPNTFNTINGRDELVSLLSNYLKFPNGKRIEPVFPHSLDSRLDDNESRYRFRPRVNTISTKEKFTQRSY